MWVSLLPIISAHARTATGKRLIPLNADAFTEPNWLEQLVKSAEKNPEFSFFSSEQIQANNSDILDGAGDTYHISGLAWRNGYNYKTIDYGQEQKELFSACAAATLIERDLFLQVTRFNEGFFSYLKMSIWGSVYACKERNAYMYLMRLYRGTPRILEKRKMIQRNVKVKPFALLKVLSTGLFEPYLEFQRRN